MSRLSEPASITVQSVLVEEAARDSNVSNRQEILNSRSLKINFDDLFETIRLHVRGNHGIVGGYELVPKFVGDFKESRVNNRPCIAEASFTRFKK